MSKPLHVRVRCISVYKYLLLLLLGSWKTEASQAAGKETLVGIVGKDFILLGADSSVSQSLSLTASNLDKIASLSEPFPYDGKKYSLPTEQQAILAAAVGDAADSDRLIGLLQAHATIQEYQSGVGCDVRFYPDDVDMPMEPGVDVEGMAYLARSTIASSLRSRAPLKVCVLVAGMIPTSAQPTRGPSFISRQLQQQVEQASGIVGAEKVKSGENGDVGLIPRLYWLDEYGSVQNIQYGAHGFASNFCLSILDQGYHPHLSLEEATTLLNDCFQQLRTRYVINSPDPPCIKCVDANGVRRIR